MEKIIIISDVHLSDNKNYSWFRKENAEKIQKFLLRTSNDPEVKELVLLGDIFDLWLYPPSIAPLNPEEIIKQWDDSVSYALRECVRKLPNVYYIKGNHDMEVTAQDIASINSDGKRLQWIAHEEYNKKHPNILHVEHGNDADMFNVPPPYPLGYAITRMVAAAENFIGFFDIWGEMKSIIKSHHSNSRMLVDQFSGMQETIVFGFSPNENNISHELRIKRRAISTTISLEEEVFNMTDEMLKKAEMHSSVNSNNQIPMITMPDGKKISINELNNQFSTQVLNAMPKLNFRPESSVLHGNQTSLNWNADNVSRSLALTDQEGSLWHRESSFALNDYISNLFNSALASDNLDWHAKEMMRQTAAKIIVMGHTHKPTLKFSDNRWYANSGCWCEDKVPSYVTVFMQDDPSVEVTEYSGDQGDDRLIQGVPL